MVSPGVRGRGGDLYRLLTSLVRPRPAHGDGGGQGARVVVGSGRESLSLKVVRQHFLGHFALQQGMKWRYLPNCLYCFISQTGGACCRWETWDGVLGVAYREGGCDGGRGREGGRGYCTGVVICSGLETISGGWGLRGHAGDGSSCCRGEVATPGGETWAEAETGPRSGHARSW